VSRAAAAAFRIRRRSPSNLPLLRSASGVFPRFSRIAVQRALANQRAQAASIFSQVQVGTHPALPMPLDAPEKLRLEHELTTVRMGLLAARLAPLDLDGLRRGIASSWASPSHFRAPHEKRRL
jgi:hypothetical protein